jgi:hypothetical protein
MGLAGLAACTELRKLNLARTPIRGAGFKALAPLVNLLELDLAGTAVNDESIAELKNLTALRILNLARTGLNGDWFRELADLPYLQSLNLEEAPLTDANLSALAKARCLQVLNLRGVPVTAVGVEPLNVLSLTTIDLSKTKVGPAAYKALAKNKSLRLLVVDQTKVSDGSLAGFATALPMCTISGPDRTPVPASAAATLPPRYPRY